MDRIQDILINSSLAIGVGVLVYAAWEQGRRDDLLSVSRLITPGERLANDETCGDLDPEQVDIVYRDEIATLGSLLETDDRRMIVCVGPVVDREAFIRRAISLHWRGDEKVVDLPLSPIEDLGSWSYAIGRQGFNVTLLRRAIEQLHELVRGGTANASALKGEEAASVTLNQFKETLLLNQRNMSAQYKKTRTVLRLVGLEMLDALTRDETGRRAVSIFISWISNLALVGVVIPVVSCSSSFYFHWFTAAEVACRHHLLALPVRPAKLWPVATTLSEHLLYKKDKNARNSAAVNARTRYRLALVSSRLVMQFAPYECVSSDACSSSSLLALLRELTASDYHAIDIVDAVRILDDADPRSLHLLLRAGLLVYDAAEGRVCLPTIADIAGVSDLLISMHAIDPSSTPLPPVAADRRPLSNRIDEIDTLIDHVKAKRAARKGRSE